MIKISKTLYRIARKIGKAAVIANDVETLMTLDPKKIAKRAARKAIWKTNNKITRSMTKKIK